MINPFAPHMFVVVCRASQDERDINEKSEYVRATRTIFHSEEAAQRYAFCGGISLSREPRILPLDQYLIQFEGWRLTKEDEKEM